MEAASSGSHFCFPRTAGRLNQKVSVSLEDPSQSPSLCSAAPFHFSFPQRGVAWAEVCFFLHQGSGTQGTSLPLQQGNSPAQGPLEHSRREDPSQMLIHLCRTSSQVASGLPGSFPCFPGQGESLDGHVALDTLPFHACTCLS